MCVMPGRNISNNIHNLQNVIMNASSENITTTPLPTVGRMNQGAGLPIFQKQMYRATNGHPATMADVIFITFDDCLVFSNRFLVLKPTHNLY